MVRNPPASITSQATSHGRAPGTPGRIASVLRLSDSSTTACMCLSWSGASPKQNVRVMSAQNRLALSLGKTSMMIDSPGLDRAAAEVVDAGSAGARADDRRLALAAVGAQHRDDLLAHPLAGQRLAAGDQSVAAGGGRPDQLAGRGERGLGCALGRADALDLAIGLEPPARPRTARDRASP